MNAQTIEYLVYKGGDWVNLLTLNYRDGMPIPAKWMVLHYEEVNYEVTKVAFNISNAAIEVEVARLA
jgi:hypothetical protein